MYGKRFYGVGYKRIVTFISGYNRFESDKYLTYCPLYLSGFKDEFRFYWVFCVQSRGDYPFAGNNFSDFSHRHSNCIPG